MQVHYRIFLQNQLNAIFNYAGFTEKSMYCDKENGQEQGKRSAVPDER